MVDGVDARRGHMEGRLPIHCLLDYVRTGDGHEMISAGRGQVLRGHDRAEVLLALCGLRLGQRVDLPQGRATHRVGQVHRKEAFLRLEIDQRGKQFDETAVDLLLGGSRRRSTALVCFWRHGVFLP